MSLWENEGRGLERYEMQHTGVLALRVARPHMWWDSVVRQSEDLILIHYKIFDLRLATEW